MGKAEKGIERRDKQLKDMGNRLDVAVQEQESATAKAKALREQLDATNALFDQTKQKLQSASKELKVDIKRILNGPLVYWSVLLDSELKVSKDIFFI